MIDVIMKTAETLIKLVSYISVHKYISHFDMSKALFHAQSLIKAVAVVRVNTFCIHYYLNDRREE